MASAAGISDLLALAVIRRILLELGHPLQPEPPGTLVGPLEIWMHQPRPELDDQSPLRALEAADGEARVRRCLLDLTASLNSNSAAHDLVVAKSATGESQNPSHGSSKGPAAPEP